MIGRLTGVVLADDAEGGVLLDVAGVGYEVVVPTGTVARVKALAPESDTVTLHVHTHVREDALALYGFATPADKATFRLLISVSNIGPKSAIAVLSAMSAEDLAQALSSKDLPRLVGIPGIGRKTAERLLLELKDKLTASIAFAPAAASPKGPRSGEPAKEELLSRALTGLGYRPAEADRAIEQLRTKLPETPVQELIRDALAILSR